MIAHIAIFTFGPEMTEARLLRLAAELRAMARSFPSVKKYTVGPNLRLRQGVGDLAVVAVVEDQQGLDAYLDSQEHVQLVARDVEPYLVSRQAAQILVPADWSTSHEGISE